MKSTSTLVIVARNCHLLAEKTLTRTLSSVSAHAGITKQLPLACKDYHRRTSMKLMIVFFIVGYNFTLLGKAKI